MPTVIRLLLPLGLLMFCLPVSAQANVGLPMIVPMGFLMIAALLPIIGVEAWVISVRLDVGFGVALAASGAANAVSTIVGTPLNWLLGGVLVRTASGFLPRSNAAWKKLLNVIRGNLFWLIGGYTEKNIDWIIPSAELALLVPMFFLSWWIESLVVSSMLEGTLTDRISSAVFVANLLSYALLALVPMWFLVRSRKTFLAAIHRARAVRVIHEGLTPDGRRMTADQYGTIRFFDAQTGRQVEVLDPIRAEMVCEAVSADGRFSVGLDEHGHAVWEHAKKRKVCRLTDDETEEFGGWTFSEDARLLAANVYLGGIHVWNCETGNSISSFDADDGDSIAFSPDSRMLAANSRKSYDPDDEASDLGVVYVWNLETCKLIHTLDGHELYPELKFSADGRQLAVQGRGEIFVYRTDDWELSHVLEGKDTQIRDWA
jgi:hypothetical protein